jgi:hypothetical protein
VQKAGCSSPLDDLDAVLRSGLSVKRVAMPPQVTDLFLSPAARCKIRTLEVSERHSPLAKASLAERLGITDA